MCRLLQQIKVTCHLHICTFSHLHINNALNALFRFLRRDSLVSRDGNHLVHIIDRTTA